MPSTTNFNWTTPADTDLVKDGALAIRTLANGIDTSFVDLKGGTTGQVLSKASNTDLDFSFTTITAGGMTLISTTTCSSTSVTLSSIPQTYKSLYLIVKNVTFASGANALLIKPNSVTNLVDWSGLREAGTATGITNSQIRLSGGGSEFNGASTNAWALTIDNYAATDSYKPFMFSGFCVNGSGTNRDIFAGGAFRSNTAISSLLIDIEGATFTGGTILLYGVN